MSDSKDYKVGTWDFTYNFPDEEACKQFDHKDFVKHLGETAVKWAYQVEQGAETKRFHLQGRVRVRTRTRLNGIKAQFPMLPNAHWSVTCAANAAQGKAFSYVIKKDTRVAGPWTDKQPEPKVKQQRVRKLEERGFYKWQKIVADDCKSQTIDERTINVLVDPTGKIGKGTLVAFLMYHDLAQRVPPINDATKLIGFCIDFPSRCYIVDMPKALGKDKLSGLWNAIEQLKDGELYDWRHKGRQKTIEQPNVWVFTNSMPDWSTMSVDRWRLWTVDHKTMDMTYLDAEDAMKAAREKTAVKKRKADGTEVQPEPKRSKQFAELEADEEELASLEIPESFDD